MTDQTHDLLFEDPPDDALGDQRQRTGVPATLRRLVNHPYQWVRLADVSIGGASTYCSSIRKNSHKKVAGAGAVPIVHGLPEGARFEAKWKRVMVDGVERGRLWARYLPPDDERP